jgi:hypothetical protein
MIFVATAPRAARKPIKKPVLFCVFRETRVQKSDTDG